MLNNIANNLEYTNIFLIFATIESIKSIHSRLYPYITCKLVA